MSYQAKMAGGAEQVQRLKKEGSDLARDVLVLH